MFIRLSIYALCLVLAGCSSWSRTYEPSRPVPDQTQTPGHSASAENSHTASQVSGSSTLISAQNIDDFYVVFGRRYAVMKDSTGFKETGIASWYGEPFHGQKTSNGEIYDMYQMTAAHKHLPLPTFVKVTRVDNGSSVIVRVNDRGPFKDERVIDLSYAAAKQLDMLGVGTTQVRIESLDELNKDIMSQRQNAAPVFVQVGSYRERGNADSTRALLHTIGIRNTRLLFANDPGTTALYRLQIGPVYSGSEYDELIAKLKTVGISDTVIIRQ